MITYGSHGQYLTDNGYSVIPLRPNTKKPLKGWMSPSVRFPFSQYNNYSIGIRCGTKNSTVYGVDLDIKNEDFINHLVNKVSFKNNVYRIGNPPKRLYLFKGLISGLRKRKSNKYAEGHIEFLGYGQQFAAFGTHPVTNKPYTWPYKSPLSIPREKLLTICEPDIIQLMDTFDELTDLYGFTLIEKNKKETKDTLYDPDNPLFEKTPIGLSKKELAEIVGKLDPDCNRDMWRDVGFALHYETEGSEIGYTIWDNWSSLGTKYKEGETEKQWDSFGRNDRVEPVTFASVIKWSKEISLKENEDKLKVEIGVNLEDPFATLNGSVSRFAKEAPVLEMVIDNVMPKGITSLLFSAGGAGKSTLMLYLATRVAFSNYFPCNFAGNNIHGGSVVILTAEDPEIVLNRRYVATVSELSRELNIEVDKVRNVLNENLQIISTFGKSIHLFGIKKDAVKPTKAFVSFVKKMKSISNLQLIIVDTKTRYSPGEGLGNVTASQEITYYEMLALITGASIVLLHHTNKKSRDGSQDGSQAYRDATTWFDNTRLSWFFRPANKKEIENNSIELEKANEYFILENPKNNYVKKHADKLVHRSGYSFTFKDTDISNDGISKIDTKRQDLIDNIVAWAQSLKEKEVYRAEMLKWCKNELNVGRSRVIAAIENACDDGILELIDGNMGKAKIYRLTEYGLRYNLHID